MLRLAILMVVLAGDATALTFLSESGDWRGRGVFREKIDAPLIKGQCRFRTTVEGPVTQVKGKCGAAVGAAPMNMALTRLGDGALAAQISSTAFEDVLVYEGQEAEAGAILNTAKPHRLDDGSFDLTLELVWQDDGFVLQQFVAPAGGGERVLVVKMTFAPRQ